MYSCTYEHVCMKFILKGGARLTGWQTDVAILGKDEMAGATYPAQDACMPANVHRLAAFSAETQHSSSTLLLCCSLCQEPLESFKKGPEGRQDDGSFQLVHPVAAAASVDI